MRGSLIHQCYRRRGIRPSSRSLDAYLEPHHSALKAVGPLRQLVISPLRRFVRKRHELSHTTDVATKRLANYLEVATHPRFRLADLVNEAGG